jgi:histone acetyltransferase (RNA polymerase elongator complex component)
MFVPKVMTGGGTGMATIVGFSTGMYVVRMEMTEERGCWPGATAGSCVFCNWLPDSACPEAGLGEGTMEIDGTGVVS